MMKSQPARSDSEQGAPAGKSTRSPAATSSMNIAPSGARCQCSSRKLPLVSRILTLATSLATNRRPHDGDPQPSMTVIAGKCSVFRDTKTRIRTEFFEPKSALPGNGIFRLETNGPKRRRSSRRGARGDKTYSQNPADSGLIAGFGEISVRTRMRGGAERSPTLGRINSLQKVRVEMGSLSGKGDFSPTRTYGTE